MRIVKIDFPDLPDFGLKAMKADRLGNLVILAGKNGSGKSRLLRRLEAWTNENVPGHGTRYVMSANFWGIRPNRPEFSTLSKVGWWKNDAAWLYYAKTFHRDMSDSQRHRMYDLTFDQDGLPKIIHFVPHAIGLADPQNMNSRMLSDNAERACSIGVDQISESAFPRLQWLQNRWWNAKHPESAVPRELRDQAIHEYEALNQLIDQLLGTNIDRDLEGRATLFGFPLGEANLSDGQRVLLQFCVAVHAQADSLSELIVLMDEPENHLHPGIMLDVIEKIRLVLKNGQLWIATHSVALLSNFDADSIWWMNDGTLRHAGSHPELVLAGLIGGEERISKLSDFLGLPASLASNNFAFQCMLPPAVVLTGDADPQTEQVRKLILNLHPGKKLDVLDFGAGRGRLLAAMASEYDPAALTARIEYKAYDSTDANKSECEAAVARVYGAADGRCFFSDKELRSHLDERSQDIIVMCNVLHEIDPTEWLKLFSASGLIGQYLKPKGFLLLVEDTEMRIGEKAHAKGFMVLDTPDLRALFSITSADADFKFDDARGDGRLKAHLIPATCVHRITRESLIKALKRVRETALTEVKTLRASSDVASYREGRKHAFQVQQLANSHLALESIGES